MVGRLQTQQEDIEEKRNRSMIESSFLVSHSKNSKVRIIMEVFRKLESIINKEVVVQFSRNNLLRDKQYGFRSSRSIADILTVIRRRINKTHDDSFIMRAIDFRAGNGIISYTYTGACISEDMFILDDESRML